MTWSKGRTRSDGDTLPTPEREAKRETQRGTNTRGTDRGKRHKREGEEECMCVCAGMHACIWEKARLENIELESTANEAGGRN